MRLLFFSRLSALGLTLLWPGLPTGQELKESYSARGQAYGVTYDGQNFWYSEPASRKIFRIDASGRAQGFYLGNRQIYGLQFNVADGLIYIGAEKELLKVSPATGSLVGRQPVPVDKVAGLDFGSNFWYLLEKDTGIIHFYDPGLGRIVSTFATGVKDARDITINRGAFWLTDGRAGQILRFHMEDRKLTGSIRAPEEARGLSFTRNQLWVVNRSRQAIERLSYSDSSFYITSDEVRHRVRIQVSFSLSSSGTLHVVQAGSSVYQTVRNVKTGTSGFKEGYLPSGQKSFRAVLGPGSHSFSYECLITARNVNYLVPDPYPSSTETLADSPARHYSNDESGFLSAPLPAALLKATNEPTLAARSLALKKSGLPVRESLDVRRQTDRFSALQRNLQVYLRGLGWLPLAGANGGGAFTRTAEDLELFVAPGNAAASPAYLESNGTLQPIDATVTVDLITL
ncbi:MAG: hypothetical protein HS115_04725 [Spirochaetales bacterium]|nr:hypothetical protein [Spirochaetales bacterium]